jgi:predicted phosphodiesterase
MAPPLRIFVVGGCDLKHKFAVWQGYGLNDVCLWNFDHRNLVMRIAAIYDIHGNLSALEAVLQEIHEANVDNIVVGGDVVPGPLPLETIQCLLALDTPAQYIHGNGDREVLAQMSGFETDWYRTAPEQWREPIRWTAKQLDTHHRRLFEGWPPTHRVTIPGLGEVLFCHATPRNDTEIFTRLTPDERLLPIFEGLGVSVVVCGHTHMQFDRMIGATRVVNAGSVGMPFGEPGADWLLLDRDVQLRHTRYDFIRAAKRIRSTTYPQGEDFASRTILHPPSESETLAAFTRAELR